MSANLTQPHIEIPRALEPMRLPPLPDNPLVSVLMANYNYAAFIGSAIESVLNQTYNNWELIISDDGSTDTSCEIVEGFAAGDGRIRLIRGEINSGHTTVINRAYSVSRGQIICFLDSDDVYLPEKISRVVERLREKANAGLLLHRMLTVDMDERPIQEIPYMTTFAEGWIASRLLRSGGDWPVTPVCGLNFRREVTDLLFPLPVDKSLPGNTGGLLRTIGPLLTEVTGINESLYHYRIHGQNVYGAMSLTLERLSRDTAAREWDNIQLRRIMTELGLPERAIDLHRSMQHARWTFERSLLLDLPRLKLVRMLVPLIRRTFADDDSNFPRKLVRVTTYSAAVLLPLSLRVRWLNWALGRNAVKQSLSNLLSTLHSGNILRTIRLRREHAS